MMSRNGVATISHYLCFKTGYTDEELKQTGLKQVVDEDKYSKAVAKDPYQNVTNKVFSNSGVTVSKNSIPQSQKIIAIREAIQQQKDLERKMNRWPGQGYEYVENHLFEKGPISKQKGQQAPSMGSFKPVTVQQKEITAT